MRIRYSFVSNVRRIGGTDVEHITDHVEELITLIFIDKDDTMHHIAGFHRTSKTLVLDQREELLHFRSI